MRLPDPMLATPGPIPTGHGWLYEPKLDGFRCLVSTHGGRFRARSRNRWDMTTLLPELAASLPLDGPSTSGCCPRSNRSGLRTFVVALRVDD